MPSPIILLALFLAFAITNGYSYVKGGKAADTRWIAKTQTERADAEAAARATEQRHQEVTSVWLIFVELVVTLDSPVTFGLSVTSQVY